MSYMSIKYGMLSILQPKIVNYLRPAVMFKDIQDEVFFPRVLSIVSVPGILSYLHNYSWCRKSRQYTHFDSEYFKFSNKQLALVLSTYSKGRFDCNSNHDHFISWLDQRVYDSLLEEPDSRSGEKWSKTHTCLAGLKSEWQLKHNCRGTHQSVGFALPGDAALNHGILE